MKKLKINFNLATIRKFLLNIVERYVENPDQLNGIRQSMYDYSKANLEEFPHGFKKRTVTKRNRKINHGKVCIRCTLHICLR